MLLEAESQLSKLGRCQIGDIDVSLNVTGIYAMLFSCGDNERCLLFG